MNRREFKKLVTEALRDFPKEFAKYLDNLQIVVSQWPTPDQQRFTRGGLLLGLYKGIPKPQRGINYSMVLPDKITIFQGPIELIATTPDEIKKQVKKTVVHEIAHHFGISDERLRELGI